MNKESYEKFFAEWDELNKEVYTKLDDDIIELRRLRKEAKKELMKE